MMKTRPHRLILTYTSILVIAIAASCSHKTSFEISAVEPAAEGAVKYAKDKNNNYSVDLDVIRLSDPSRLTPPRSAYVVWMETEDHGTQNLGQLTSSEGFLSGKLRSSLNAVTPYQPTRFFITAEDKADISFPGQTVVLRTPRVD